MKIVTSFGFESFLDIMEDLSPKEKKALDELKRKISAEVPQHLKHDEYLYFRFLKARDFNLNVAEDMLRNHINWRRVNRIDTILTDFVPSEVDPRKALLSNSKAIPSAEQTKARMAVVIKYIPLTRIGFDKDGSPIRYFAFGDMDARGILKSAKRTECIHAVIQCFEDDVAAMKEQSARLGKPIEQWTYILNFENYSFLKATHKPTLEALIALFMAYEANYPERLKAAYIVNASIYFTILFSVIKPMLSGATIRKIQIFGKDGWKGELLKSIDPEVLPVFLGGTKTDNDGDPMCRSFIKHGAVVPDEYYLTKSSTKLSSLPGVKKITISRKSKANLDLDVQEPGSLIEWEFETSGKDIGFCLFYKSTLLGDDSMKELVPNQRVDTQLVSEAGMFQCERPGTYVLVFDNTYSWIHQKEVYCRVSVVKSKK